jgi:hypothetical protein
MIEYLVIRGKKKAILRLLPLLLTHYLFLELIEENRLFPLSIGGKNLLLRLFLSADQRALIA